MESIFKCWGERRRILLDSKNEVDLLYLKKDTFCSTHTHKYKNNKFIVISGVVRIETEYNKAQLGANDDWTVLAPDKHRFVVLENSVMIEMAWVFDGEIDPEDINRESLGGKIIDNVEYTIDQLKEKGLLEL